MLPNYETCRKHILAFKRQSVPGSHSVISFKLFWEYKMDLENKGQSILAGSHIEQTSSLLNRLFSFLKVRNSGLSEERLPALLTTLQPGYADLCRVTLGSGQVSNYRDLIEKLCAGLDETWEKDSSQPTGLSVAAGSAILMAVWGQTPRFDNLNRLRFEKWNHWPAPEKLPHLKSRQIHYRPDQFSALVAELDRWVAAWPETNYGKRFEDCFSDLCPGCPPGRLIDIIYHWKLPQSWPKCRLQTQGSGIAPAADSSIDEYY